MLPYRACQTLGGKKALLPVLNWAVIPNDARVHEALLTTDGALGGFALQVAVRLADAEGGGERDVRDAVAGGDGPDQVPGVPPGHKLTVKTTGER